MTSSTQSTYALSRTYLGRSLARVEDAAPLSGHGRFGDDLPVRVGILHAAILRSPHPACRTAFFGAGAASALSGVAAIVTGEDAERWTRLFTTVVKAPVKHWCLADFAFAIQDAERALFRRNIDIDEVHGVCSG